MEKHSCPYQNYNSLNTDNQNTRTTRTQGKLCLCLQCK